MVSFSGFHHCRSNLADRVARSKRVWCDNVCSQCCRWRHNVFSAIWTGGVNRRSHRRKPNRMCRKTWDRRRWWNALFATRSLMQIVHKKRTAKHHKWTVWSMKICRTVGNVQRVVCQAKITITRYELNSQFPRCITYKQRTVITVFNIQENYSVLILFMQCSTGQAVQGCGLQNAIVQEKCQ